MAKDSNSLPITPLPDVLSNAWAAAKLGLAIFLLLAALISLFALIHYQSEAKAGKNLTQFQEFERVSKRVQIAANEIKGTAADLMFMADEIGLHLSERGAGEALAIIAREFLAFSSRRRDYEEISFLGVNGREIMRLENFGGNSLIVPQDRLRPEIQRDYFNEALGLPRGGIYASLLVREEDAAKRTVPPHEFDLFLSTAVFDTEGRKLGVVAVHVAADRLVGELKTATPAAPGSDMLMTADGTLVYTSGIGRKNGFGSLFPAAWQRIKAAETGQFSNAEGIFTFATFYPGMEATKAAAGSAAVVTPAAARKNLWKIVSHVSPAALGAASRRLKAGLMPLFGGLLLLTAAGSWFSARAVISRRATERKLYEEKLVQLQISRGAELAKVTLHSIGDAVITMNTSGNIVFLNPVAERLTGWSNEEAQGLPFAQVCHLASASSRREEDTLPVIQKCISESCVAPIHADAMLISRNGQEFAIEDSCAPIRNPEGKIVGSVLIFKDVTERRKAQQALQQSEQQLSAVVNGVLDGIIAIDEAGIVHTFNPAAGRIFGYAPEEVIGRSVNMLMPEPYRSEHDGHIQRYLETGEPADVGIIRERVGRHKDGTVFPLEISLSEVHLNTHRRFIGIVRNIIERKEKEERLTALAQHDHLTGLANRSLFQDLLKQALVRAKRNRKMTALMFMDLDRFKVINDTLGHDIGDMLLQEVAQRLKSNVRESDAVSRLGGDEFIIFLESIEKPEDAALVAQNIVSAIDVPFRLKGHEILMTTSIGIALFPIHGEEAEILVRNADIAMYHVKELTKNGYQFYSPEMGEKSERQLPLDFAG